MSVRIFLTTLENILELSSSETGAGEQPLVFFSFVYLFVDVLKLTGREKILPRGSEEASDGCI